ncbi:BRF1-domain-containing protein [Wilcoxina mikolae CBS 423.85]|nr:BRF1-domain-containing protein [Wilcoxina mikolae CBS 423.85]
MANSCPGCGCSNPGDFDDSSGNLVCTKCGTVVNDSHIVSDITFGENSAGAATVQGSFVGAGQTHANTGGRYRSGTSIESREQTIAEARRRINTLAAVLNCPDHFSDAAQRWYTLAITNNFTHGRKAQYVVACCLYIVCRLEKSSHMLIDFSDVLHINVFTLGQTYLKLINLLKVRMPNIDPTIYIHRFAKYLEFGNDQNKVAKDALRLIQRMNRDWIVQGRRPSGICGAALILAARMNNFRRSVREVVYVVKVADLTIHKRLQEFKETRSGDLTVEEFRSIWLEQSHDPPSFGPKKKKRKRVRRVNDEGEIIEEYMDEHGNLHAQPEDPVKEPSRRDADGFVIPEIPIDPALVNAGTSEPSKSVARTPESSPSSAITEPAASATHGLYIPDEATTAIAESAIESEISTLLNDTSSAAIVEELHRAHEATIAALPKNVVSDDPENLHDVDDDWEVQAALLNDQESEMKEKIWTEFNKDWIRDQEIKRLKAASDARMGIVKTQRKRKKNKPRDSSSADLAASPAESAKEMLKRRAYSKKINYKAIEGLFDD